MNISRFISKRIIPRKNHRFSRPIINISIISVGLGVCVMMLAFAITNGFRQEIQKKVIGFGSHIEITYFDDNQSYENTPITKSNDLVEEIKNLENVKHIQAFASKAGIVKTEQEIEGVVFKGVESDYSSDFFQQNIVRGSFPLFNDSFASNQILISEVLSNKLYLDTGSRLIVYFIQEQPRQRVFTVAGIYNTGLVSHDQLYAICDIKHIQKLNDWEKNQIDGFELTLHDFNKLDETNQHINAFLPYDLISQTIIAKNRDIFDWISLFDQNIFILILLIIIVTAISLISTQLTIILEQISTIGILRTLGCNQITIRNIFLQISSTILAKGLLAGNAIGLLLCFLQHQFHIFKLNPQHYFVSYVPIQLTWEHFFGINIFVIIICLLILILPAHFVICKINIVDTLRFE